MYKISYETCNDTIMSKVLFEEYHAPIDRCFREINQIIEETIAPSLRINDVETEMFGEAGNTGNKMVTPNAVAKKIGNSIKTLIEKIKEMGRKFLNTFRKQDTELQKMNDRMRKAIKEHPELKDQIILSAKEGSLMLRDIEDIKKFESEYKKMAAEKDPSKLKSAFAKFKNKWDDPESSKTLKRVGAAAAVVGLAASIFTLVKKMDDAGSVLRKANEDSIKEAQEIQRLFEAQGLTGKNVYENIDIRKAMLQYHKKKHAEFQSTLLNNRNSLMGRCGKFLNKVSGGKYGEHVKDKNQRAYADLMRKAQAGNINDFTAELRSKTRGSREYNDILGDIYRSQHLFKYFDNYAKKGGKK